MVKCHYCRPVLWTYLQTWVIQCGEPRFQLTIGCLMCCISQTAVKRFSHNLNWLAKNLSISLLFPNSVGIRHRWLEFHAGTVIIQKALEDPSAVVVTTRSSIYALMRGLQHTWLGERTSALHLCLLYQHFYSQRTQGRTEATLIVQNKAPDLAWSVVLLKWIVNRLGWDWSVGIGKVQPQNRRSLLPSLADH